MSQMGKLSLKLSLKTLVCSEPWRLGSAPSWHSCPVSHWHKRSGLNRNDPAQSSSKRDCVSLEKGGPAAFLAQLFHCGLNSKFSRLLKCCLDVEEAILWNLWTMKSYSVHIIETLLPESPKHYENLTTERLEISLQIQHVILSLLQHNKERSGLGKELSEIERKAEDRSSLTSKKKSASCSWIPRGSWALLFLTAAL